MTRFSHTDEQQGMAKRKQGKAMDKWKLAVSVTITALSALALAIAYRHPIVVHAAVPGPFATDRLADNARISLGDGRTLTLSGGVLRLGDKRVGLTSPRHYASLTAMPTGQVLIWGGVDDEGRLIEAGEWFEPSTGALVTTGRLGLPTRAAHTLSVLSDGSLAMTGGWGPGNVPAHEVAVWRPLDRHLELKPGDATHARLGGDATLLADGTLKVSGGIDDVGRPVHEAWRFGTPERRETVAAGIAASYPLKDADSASPIGPLALRFDEPIDAAQLNSTVSLLGPNGVVKIRVVGAENGRLVFLQLPDELYPSARYTIFVQGLHTAGGKPVPYEAIGFTTRAARNGVVLAGEGKRPGTESAEPTERAQYIMAGEGKTRTCRPSDAFHLCRNKGEVKDGAFYPGQDNVATASGGHWRLYKDRQTLPDTRQLEANLPKGATALVGQVRRIDDTPVANVAVTIGDQTVQTDAHGLFVLQNLPSGRRELFVDGGPAGKPGTEYGRFIVGADITAATVNHMPFVMYMPRVLDRDKIPLPSPTTHETVLTHPDIPGLELRIPTGAVFKDRNGNVLKEIAIVPTPVDRAPFPLPDNFPIYFTIQPGDAVVQGMTPEAAKGIQVVYPNYGKQKPSDKADFWVYSAKKGWEMYGAGHVSADASQLVADKDTRLVWALGAGASTNPAQPDNGKKPDNKDCGDPVDLQTGVMFERWTDLRVRDVIPIAVDRTVNSLYNPTAPFGLGTGTSLSMTLSSGNGFVSPKLVLSCGESIEFAVVAGRPEWPLVGTVWRHQATNSSFYGATLQFLNDSTPEGAHWVITMTDGDQYWFDRHTPNHLVRHSDKFGNTVSFSYEGGLLAQVTSPNGRSIRFHHNSKNLIDAVIDGAGRTVTYSYHQMAGSSETPGMLLDTVTFPDGTKEQYQYDFVKWGDAEQETWRIKSIFSRDGTRKLLNTFSADGAVTAQTFADGSKLSFVYEKQNGVTLSATVTDASGLSEKTEFDAVSLYPSKETRAFGTDLAESTTYVRDGSGLILSRTDNIGRITRYRYDGAGRVIEEVLTSGTASETTASYAYDSDGNITTITDSLGHTVKYTYENGCLASSLDETGNTLTFSCDASGQVTSIRDGQGGERRFQYRGGDLIGAIDPSGRANRFTYDVIGQKIAVTSPSGAVYTTGYDQNGRPTRYGYPDGTFAELEYDLAGNLVSFTFPNGAARHYQYDLMHRLVKRTAVDGKEESWKYEKGLLSSYTDRKAQTTLYSYDVLQRPILKASSDGEAIQTSYDKASRVIELLDSASGSIKWTYDELDRVVRVATGAEWVEYGYDRQGRRLSMMTSGGATTKYVYDSADRLTSIAQNGESVSMRYNADGNRSELTLPNGIKVSYDYDASGQLTKMNYTGATVPDRELSIGLDANGRIAVLEGGFGARLLPSPSAGDSVFDASGRQTAADGRLLTYDDNGNLSSDGTREFIWNARNQLIEIREGNATLIGFRYDALGRRITKKLPSGVEISYLYDGENIVQERVGSEAHRIFTGLETDERYSRDDTFGRAYFLTDPLGGTAALADGHGEILRTYSYGAYGEQAAGGTGDPLENPYQFAGRELDIPGLYYFRARYYSSELGRFISEDPLGLGGEQLNFYSYVHDDPLNWVDPYGLAQRVPSSFSWNRPPGAGGNYGNGVPMNRPPQPPGGQSPSETPGAWPSSTPNPFPGGGARCVQGYCTTAECTVGGPPTTWPLQFAGRGPSRFPENVPAGCVCKKWMNENDIDDGAPPEPAADWTDAAEISGKIAENIRSARARARQAQEALQRELKP